jgi:hypothetical protein
MLLVLRQGQDDEPAPHVRVPQVQGYGAPDDREQLIRTSDLIRNAIRREGKKPGMEAEVARGKAFLKEAKAALAEMPE